MRERRNREVINDRWEIKYWMQCRTFHISLSVFSHHVRSYEIYEGTNTGQMNIFLCINTFWINHACLKILIRMFFGYHVLWRINIMTYEAGRITQRHYRVLPVLIERESWYIHLIKILSPSTDWNWILYQQDGDFLFQRILCIDTTIVINFNNMDTLKILDQNISILKYEKKVTPLL